MVYSAKVLDTKTECDIIDINMGCPVNKVIKTGAESALMLNEDNINYLSLAKRLEKVGVKAITLHARTRSQMYMGKADWSYIKKLKEELKIPVIGNGDITTVEEFIKMKEYSNVDAIIIGRGCIGNPFLIKEINNYLNGKDNY